MSSADGETTSSSGYRIPSLTGQDNYKTWRIQMHAILFESNLNGYIEKTLTEQLNDTTNEKEQQKHKKHDQRALGQMQMCCSAWALTFIENAAMAREAWETLRKNFQATSISSKIFIKKEFYSTKLGDNDDIDEHIHKLHHLYQDLRIAGFILPESEFTSIILMSLPPSWDTFVTSIDAEDLDNPNKEISKNAAESILGCFCSEVIHWKSQQNSTNPSAFNSQRSTPQFKSKPNKTNTECNYCHKKGHWAWECQKHLANAEKKNANITTQKGTSNLKSTFSSTQLQFGDAWIANSGTDHHIVCNCNSFIEYHPLLGQYLTGVGGIKTQIHGCGTVAITMKLHT